MSKQRKVIDKTCVGCEDATVKTKLNSLQQIYLCETCATSEDYTLIYKTHVIRDYNIDIDSLDGCDTFSRKIRGSPTTLFKLCDVLDVFCDDYDVDRNDPDAIEAKRLFIINKKEKEKETRKLQLQTNAKMKKKTRREKLIDALSEYKLELRDDSKLCSGYIDGSIKDWSLNEIVNRMCQMKYLFDYCKMDHYLDKAYDYQQEEYKAGYIPDCSVFEHAELMALDKYGNYPNKWPWI